MSDRYLMPPNASPQEVAMAGTVARISDVPDPVNDLYTPGACPAEILPWLAWAFSVDEWNPAWTEAQKRQAIASSVFVHRHKGTVAALKTALAALGYDLTLTEWHKMTPQGSPYTFGLVLDVGETGIASLDEFQRIIDVANSAKNARSHMTFLNINSTRSCEIYMGGVVFSGETISISAGD